MLKNLKLFLVAFFCICAFSASSLFSAKFSLLNPKTGDYESDPEVIHHLVVKIYDKKVKTFHVRDSQSKDFTLTVSQNKTAQAKLFKSSRLGLEEDNKNLSVRQAINQIKGKKKNRDLEALLDFIDGFWNLELVRIRGNNEYSTSLTIYCDRVVISNKPTLTRHLSLKGNSPKPNRVQRYSIEIPGHE